MNQTVSSADANRRFSELLRAVQKGQSFVVTSVPQRPLAPPSLPA